MVSDCNVSKDNTRVFLKDCMEGMREYPDKFFDLAIVDPPYGIGMDGQKKSICKNPKHNRKEHKRKGWDTVIPEEAYFTELQRISTNQIVWGGNYFTEHLNPVKAWVFWYKGQNDLTMSDGASSLEIMQEPYVRLLNDVEYLRNSNKTRLARIEKLEKQVAAYKGVITKMKKKA